MTESLEFTLESLAKAYGGGVSPVAVVAEAFRRLDAVADPGIFIHEAREQALAEAAALGKPDGRPLWGIPFAVKDNIDVAGMPTTAACRDFAYDAGADAFVVARLRAAGAICIGKTNLDQFATGLVGLRTPYPAPRNAIDPAIVPGGSSSGSAVAVAHGIVAFALGTDTAGSGRVPAALNGIVGLKPTLGALSSTGVVPACRSLDTISIFAMTTADAWSIYHHAAAFDPADPYSRSVALPASLSSPPPHLRIAVPDAQSLMTFGETAQQAAQRKAFDATIASLRALGATIEEVDLEPFFAVARLLYEGPWIAERVAAVGERLIENPETLHPVIRAILEPGLNISASETFSGIYLLKRLERACREITDRFDALCVPSIPGFVTVEEVAADPIGPNSRLGTYTNFVNLLDLCGIAVPTGARSDGRPGSVTFLAAAGRDALCAVLGSRMEAGAMGATAWPRRSPVLGEAEAGADELAIAVCGAHMSGLPLNGELTRLGGRFLRATQTASEYSLHVLAGGPPQRPGLVRRARGGRAIAVEVWALPKERVGEFLAGIPSPLGIGTLVLADGSSVKGFLCEDHGLAKARDISEFGGWRAWLSRGADQAALTLSA